MFNCILSLLGWFSERFNNKVFVQVPFFFNLGSFAAFLFYDMIMKAVSFKRAIIFIPVLLVIDSILIYFIGEHVDKSDAKYYMLIPNITFCGFANSVLQTTLIKYSFHFTPVEISAYNSGTALVGCLANFIALANVYLLPGSDNLGKQATVYLIFQVLTLMAVISIFIKYCVDVIGPKLAKESESIANLDKQLIDTMTLGETSPSVASNGILTPTPTLLSTLTLISPYFFNMVLVYTITLGLFPQFCFSLGLGWKNKDTQEAERQLILLTYNIGDFIGKWMYGELPL